MGGGPGIEELFAEAVAGDSMSLNQGSCSKIRWRLEWRDAWHPLGWASMKRGELDSKGAIQRWVESQPQKRGLV